VFDAAFTGDADYNPAFQVTSGEGYGGGVHVGFVAFNEGPAWHPSGNLFFSDVINSRIMRMDPEGNMHTYRTPSGHANGLVFDAQGRLIACEGARDGGYRRVTRTERNGVIRVLTDNYHGKLYNSPNDVAVDPQGRIYFTDPRYGDKLEALLDSAPIKQAAAAAG